ncbi:MAG: Cof-type HAD-IIB family hydrolase [Peptostreptococcaceae bacterium]
MNYKLIVTDMDGTLLGTDHEISNENKMALEEAFNEGIKVTVATGRMHSSAKAHIDFLDLDVPIISCNGALIKDSKTEEIIYSNTIDTKKCLKIIEVLEKHKVYYQFYSEDLLMCKKRENEDADIIRMNRLISNGVNLVSKSNLLEDIKKRGILKVIIVEEKNISILEDIAKDINCIDGLEMTKSWFNNIEIMAKGSNKGNAVKIIADHLKVNKNEIIAFGDNYNDISMLEYVGTGVAMGNADEYVQSKADLVTKPNYEDGVAKAIYELIDFNLATE